jgi:hypothetical protein
VDPEKARRAYPDLENSIRQIFLAQDPDRLFELGAPPDEHDGDIHRVISKLQYASEVSDLVHILEHCRIEAPEMGRQGSSDDWRGMAPAIWEAWLAFKQAAG